MLSAPVSPYHASWRRHTTPPCGVQHERCARPLLAPVETRAGGRGDSRGACRPPRGEACALCGRATAPGACADSGRIGGSHRARPTTALWRCTYSHSIVAGGFDVTSSTTRLTPGISFTIRAETVSTRSYGSRAQSAVIASSLVTARITIG